MDWLQQWKTSTYHSFRSNTGTTFSVKNHFDGTDAPRRSQNCLELRATRSRVLLGVPWPWSNPMVTFLLLLPRPSAFLRFPSPSANPWPSVPVQNWRHCLLPHLPHHPATTSFFSKFWSLSWTQNTSYSQKLATATSSPERARSGEGKGENCPRSASSLRCTVPTRPQGTA